ncbi:hypothetical protein [Brevundimonas sp.]|uniref:hypothetical protein n=1 Tax=Brevundimonas sp. TaxID=1871086 RepID=UPI00273793CF|nr:hypothetical protein [Brevundimonas sp.]MDP3803838.1 hypothetical protein [Brevundimonas sp.]
MEIGAINPGFATAAALALITFAVHTFVGGRFAARPLLSTQNFDKASRWLNYMTWHMVTAQLLLMPAGYAWAAVRPEAVEVAVLLTVLAAILSPLSAWVAMKGGIQPWRFPSSWLFALITAAGLWGFAG